ncbi:MAG TPA: DUF72 domain-containing protein [Chthoniobacter sp.]|jgi:uncharacterized protein YecE (DUF72 family)
MADETLDLFAPTPIPRPERRIGELTLSDYRKRISNLANLGLYVGTSSWNYPGWCGTIYDESKYLTNRKFSKAKFQDSCLGEYAETFRTVCVDAGYYRFPTAEYLAGLCDQVPEGFKFAFKVTDEITIKRFPFVEKHRDRKGMVNENFLNSEMFQRLFLGPCSGYGDKIGPIIFEFSKFEKQDFAHGRDFVAALDQFLSQLPKGWQYGVEIRNEKWLQPDYFQMLRAHGVAHVYNNWTRMPPILEQLAIEGSATSDFTVSRFLLKPGRKYEAAVEQFSPYKEIQDRMDDARTAAEKILESSFELKRLGYIYINNRLEGSAPLTIAAILQLAKIIALLARREGIL